MHFIQKYRQVEMQRNCFTIFMMALMNQCISIGNIRFFVKGLKLEEKEKTEQLTLDLDFEKKGGEPD